MKYVRFLLVALAAIVFVAPAAMAQGGGGGGGQGRGGRGMIQALMANITLTAEQQAKVDSIVAKFRADRPAMPGQDADSATRADARTKMMEYNNKQYDAIREVLTDDQKKVFDENRKNMPMGRRGGGPGR
jgi:Spy/CpxP family protein refolding chaperone